MIICPVIQPNTVVYISQMTANTQVKSKPLYSPHAQCTSRNAVNAQTDVYPSTDIITPELDCRRVRHEAN